jgi:hypothetical protein
MEKLKLVAFSSLWCLLFLSCRKQENPIEGTYVSYKKGKYSVAWDTLIISKIAESRSSYKIESHTGYQRIRNAQLQPKEYANKRWTADWNEQTNAFTESLYYPPVRITADGLLLKSTAFQKLK